MPDNVLKSCADFSGGLPMLAQQIGHSVWVNLLWRQPPEHEMDFVFRLGIDNAAQEIGSQYLESSVVNALKSKHYQSILHKIGQSFPPTKETFLRRELSETIDLSESEKKVLDNFLNRMRKLGAILPVEGGQRGEYRFPSLLHHYYFLIAAYKSDIRTLQDKKR